MGTLLLERQRWLLKSYHLRFGVTSKITLWLLMTMFVFPGVTPLDEVIGSEVNTWPDFGHQILLGFGNEIQRDSNLFMVVVS